MKIALVSSTPVPRVYGGMDRLLEGLSAALRRRHPTDLVTLPVDERSADGVMRGYHEFYHLDLSDYDIVISYKAPAYMVRHPVHVLYLSHRLRVFYDLYEPRDAQHARMRRLIHWMDSWAMSPERIPHIFCVGNAVTKRLLKWGGIASTPIHHPTTFEPDPPRAGEHLFAVGRLHAWKRFDLIIRAMRASRADLPLVIAGTGPDEAALRELAGGDPRIRFVGHVDEAQLRDAYARAVATVFPPINEDLGMVTWESFLSGKPVVTTSDAGEPAEIVREGVTGFVTEPTPEAMAARFDWIAAHRAETEAMGEACRAHMAEITWDRLVDALLDAAARTRGRARHHAASRRALAAGAGAAPAIATGGAAADKGEPDSDADGGRLIRLLVTDNQMIDPPNGGGRVRIWELYRHLPDDFTTTYLGTHDHPGPEFRDQWMAPNFREIVMPLTTLHFKAHELWRRVTCGQATVDVTMPLLLGRCSPRYASLLARLLPEADLLICSHPWMTPWLPRGAAMPFVYDSHNCEAAVKAPLLRATVVARWLARRVERTEREAVRRARLTLACSPEDAAQFTERYGADPAAIAAVPNGVDCARLTPGAAADKPALRRRLGLPPDQPLAVFVGSNYGPNLEAVSEIVERMAPRLPKAFFAIGGGAGPAWRETNPAAAVPLNVRLLGFLEAEDLVRLYQAADVALNPMTHGSGTNIKMLDAMAAGLAIVTTPTGARGLAGRDGEHWVITEVGAGHEAAHAGAIERLLGDAAARQRLGAAARALAESDYDWRGIAARLAAALRGLLAAEKA